MAAPPGAAVLDGDAVLDVVRRACAVVLEVDPAGVARATRFADDLGADSLALVEIVEVTEEELSARARRPLRIEDEDLDALVTVGDAVDHALALL